MSKSSVRDEIQNELNSRGLGDGFDIRGPSLSSSTDPESDKVVLIRRGDRRAVEVPSTAALETLRQRETWSADELWQAFNRQGFVL